MSGASPLAYPPATFPNNLLTVTRTPDSAAYLQTTNTTGNLTISHNTQVNLKDGANNADVPYRLTAQAYTGISNQFVLDVSGLVSGDTHKVIFTDKSAAGLAYTQQNKIDMISFTPTFNSANTATSSSVVGSPDVSMINYARTGNLITNANGGMQFDCARITLKDRVNIYDGAEMQVNFQNNTLKSGDYNQDRIVKFSSNANTAPPLLINGGPGGPSDFTVNIDSSANSEVAGQAAKPTTGVVSLDMGSKIFGVGIDISQVIVAYTDTTDLDLTSVTLDYTKDGRSSATYTRYKAKAATLTNAGALGDALTDAKLKTAGALAAATYTAVPLVGAASSKETATVDITVADTVTTAAGAKTIGQAAVAGTNEAGKVAPATTLASSDLTSSAAIPTNATTAADGAITATLSYTASTNSFGVTLSGIAAKINPGSGAANITATNKTLTITVPADGNNDNDALNALGVFSIILDNTILTKTVVLANGAVGNGYKLDEAVGIAAGKLGTGSLAISSLLSANTTNFEDDATAFAIDSPMNNRKKLTNAEIDSGKIENAFEIPNSNSKTYEFTVAYKDAKGIIGVAYGANSAGIMSEGAGPITLGTVRSGDLAGEKADAYGNAIAANNKMKMNGGQGKVVYLPWTKPAYIPGTLLNYKVYWLSEKDASNSLGGSGGAGESYNFLFADAQKKGNMITVDPSLSAIVPVGENYSGAAFDFDGTKNAAAFNAIDATDGSGNWGFWVTATVQKEDGTIVDGQVKDPVLPLYSTNATAQNRSVKPRNYVTGAPSAPELFKVLGGKDVQALATGESQLPNHVMENRLNVKYYDDNAESGGSTIDGVRFAVFRTQDVPYLPAEIADASFNSALDTPVSAVTNGIDFKNLESSDSASTNFVTDYYDDLSGVWRNVGLATGGHKHNIKDNTPVNKYYANNMNIQNLRDGQSYTVFMKLSNANGGGVISVGKSALVSSKPNARSFLPGDLKGLPNTVLNAANYPDVLGDYWLGSDNDNAANSNADRGRQNNGATFIGRSNTNPESFLNGVHMNNNNRNAQSIFDDHLSAGDRIQAPAPLTSGVKDSSYCTIDDKHL
jgi:hypothetical protein